MLFSQVIISFEERLVFRTTEELIQLMRALEEDDNRSIISNFIDYFHNFSVIVFFCSEVIVFDALFIDAKRRGNGILIMNLISFRKLFFFLVGKYFQCTGHSQNIAEIVGESCIGELSYHKTDLQGFIKISF